MNQLRQAIVGVDRELPLVDGRSIPYINFDNAASTPALRRVLDRVNAFMDYYSSIHRGTGFKSRLSSEVYENARFLAGDFVGIDPDEYTVIFGKNATEAINKLSYRLRLAPDSVIIVSLMEHHSNDLPWRHQGRVLHAPVRGDDGSLDLEGLERMIQENREKLALVAVSGASNVTGHVTPIRKVGDMAHAAGAMFMVDGAQLVPHKPVDMQADNIDFLTYSAHKMYAPFGTGVLVARRSLLTEDIPPEYPGGGTVRCVSIKDVTWNDPPFRDESGSPNVVGAVALAEAIRFFKEVGFARLESVERTLTTKLLEELIRIPGVTIYGKSDPHDLENRLGVVPFNLGDIPHALLAAVLAYEYGIGVRNGCFCAHPYIKHLLGIAGEAEIRLGEKIRQDDRRDLPGAVRISFGFYNEAWEVDRLLAALREIWHRREQLAGNYEVITRSGEYVPRGYKDDFSDWFAL